MTRIGLLVFLAALLFGGVTARAETLKQVAAAPHSQRVYDYTGVLSRDERIRLRGQLVQMERLHVAQ